MYDHFCINPYHPNVSFLNPLKLFLFLYPLKLLYALFYTPVHNVTCFFSAHPQCCLTFSWIYPQMLLKCFLISVASSYCDSMFFSMFVFMPRCGPRFMDVLKCLKATEPLWGDSLLFTTKPPEISATHFFDLPRMKGWDDLGATQGFQRRTPGLGI